MLMTVSKTITELKRKKASLRCNDVKQILESLGFTVRDGKRGGHKVFTHTHLTDFEGGSFNCDHGKNPQIKPAYIQRIVKLLEQYKVELAELGGD